MATEPRPTVTPPPGHAADACPACGRPRDLRVSPLPRCAVEGCDEWAATYRDDGTPICAAHGLRYLEARGR